jgi:hypothetical protein
MDINTNTPREMDAEMDKDIQRCGCRISDIGKNFNPIDDKSRTVPKKIYGEGKK